MRNLAIIKDNKTSHRIIPDSEANNTKVQLQTTNGVNYGEVSQSAYSAIRGGYLDKYKPQDDNEKKVLENFKKKAGILVSYDKIKQSYDNNKFGLGNIDLTTRPVYTNADGKISTVSSFSINEDGKEILLPTVFVDEKGAAKMVSQEEAIERYHKTGEHLGKFDTVEEANDYANKLHIEQDVYYSALSDMTPDERITLQKYGYNPSTFSGDDFKKWAEAHNFEYRMAGNDLTGTEYKWLPKAASKWNPWKTLTTDEEEKDKKILERFIEKKNIKANSKNHPIATSAITVVTAPIRGLAGAVATGKDLVNTALGNGVNPYDTAHEIVDDATLIRGTVTDEHASKWFGGASGKLGNYGSLLYNGAMSIGDTVVTSATLSGIGGAMGLTGKALASFTANTTSGLLASNSAASTIMEKKKAGLSDWKAVGNGLATGAAEFLTEKFSLEAIFNNPTTILKQGVRAFLAEGSEEMASDILSKTADYFISGKDSEIKKSINEYVNSGYSKKEATKKAIEDSIYETLSAGLVGGFSGVAVSGAYNGFGVSDFKKLGAAYKDIAADILQSGLDSPKDSVAYKYAEKLSKKGVDNITDYELGLLHNYNVKQIAYEEEHNINPYDDASTKETVPNEPATTRTPVEQPSTTNESVNVVEGYGVKRVAPGTPTVEVGEVYVNNSNGNTITIIARDKERTTFSVSDGTRTVTKTMSNAQADTIFTGKNYTQDDFRVTNTGGAPTEPTRIVLTQFGKNLEAYGDEALLLAQKLNLKPTARFINGINTPVVSIPQADFSFNGYKQKTGLDFAIASGIERNPLSTQEKKVFAYDFDGKIRFKQIDINYDNNNYRADTPFNVMLLGQTDIQQVKGGIIGKYGVHLKDNGFFGVTLLSSGMDVASYQTSDEAIAFAKYVNNNIAFNDIAYVRDADGKLGVEPTPEFIEYGEQLKAAKTDKTYLGLIETTADPEATVEDISQNSARLEADTPENNIADAENAEVVTEETTTTTTQSAEVPTESNKIEPKIEESTKNDKVVAEPKKPVKSKNKGNTTALTKKEISYLATGEDRTFSAAIDNKPFISNGFAIFAVDEQTLNAINEQTDSVDSTRSESLAKAVAKTISDDPIADITEVQEVVRYKRDKQTNEILKHKTTGKELVAERAIVCLIDETPVVYNAKSFDVLNKIASTLKAYGKMPNPTLVGFDTEGNFVGMVLPKRSADERRSTGPFPEHEIHPVVDFGGKLYVYGSKGEVVETTKDGKTRYVPKSESNIKSVGVDGVKSYTLDLSEKSKTETKKVPDSADLKKEAKSDKMRAEEKATPEDTAPKTRVSEYTEGMKPMQKGKIEKTLNSPYKTKEYGLLTYAEFMERSIADGRQLEERKDLKAKVRNGKADFEMGHLSRAFDKNKSSYHSKGMNNFDFVKEARELKAGTKDNSIIKTVDPELYYYLTGDESALPESCYDKSYCVMTGKNQFYSVPKTVYDYGLWLQKQNKTEDVSFSLDDVIEEEKDLIAIHNIYPEKLKGSLELGGFPMPSIAVTKAKELFTKFGDISILFRKDTIDPKNKKNKVYSGDAYTPTFPQIDYLADGDVLKSIQDKVYALVGGRELANELDHISLDADNVQHTLGRFGGNVVQGYADNATLKYAFLKDKEVDLELPTKEKPLYRYGEVPNRAVISFANRLTNGKQSVKELLEQHSKELMADHDLKESIAWALNNDVLYDVKKGTDEYRTLTENPLYKADEIDLSTVLGMLEAAQKYFTNNSTVGATVDSRKATDDINEYIKKNNLEKEYHKWINDLFKGVISKKGIRNNVDVFTPSGNRRGFNALHYELNLENLVKSMTSGAKQGVSAFGGSIFGGSTVAYNSISDIKKNKGRLQSVNADDFDAMRREFTDRFYDIARNYAVHSEGVWGAQEVLVEAIVKRKTKDGIKAYLQQEGKGWARNFDTVTDDIIKLVNDIRQMPTEYFEAKPERVVGFDEIAAVIVPDNLDAELRTEIENLGVEVVTYDHTDKTGESRIAAVNSVDGIKFAMENKKGVSNNERRNNATNGGLGWGVSESADKPGRSIHKTTSSLEEGSRQRTNTESARRIYAENVRSVQGTEIRQQDAFRCEFIKPEHYTDDMRAIEEHNAKRGIKHTYFFLGSGDVAFKSTVKFRGAISKGSVYIQCDHPRYSPEQINKHEFVHHNYNSDDVKKVRDYINKNLSDEEKRYIIDVMYSRYAGVCKGNVEKVFEEFVCDVLSGMNPYSVKFTDTAAEFWAKHSAFIDNYSASDYAENIDAGGASLSSQEYADTFYSKMAKEIEGIKQEKIGASSVVSYLKGKGVKDEEIKWSGIEEWLHGKKSVTKNELLEFAKNGMLHIETQTLDNAIVDFTKEQLEAIAENDKNYDAAVDAFKKKWNSVIKTPLDNYVSSLATVDVTRLIARVERQHFEDAPEQKAYVEAKKQLIDVIKKNDYFGFDDEVDAFFEIGYDPEYFIGAYEMSAEDANAIRVFAEKQQMKKQLDNKKLISDADRASLLELDKKIKKAVKVGNDIDAERNKRSEKYKTHWGVDVATLKGGTNYREFLFKAPHSDYSNYAMNTHWKGETGVVAHARVQDFFDTEGNKTLFIEEIQSDWHNEGAKKGYTSNKLSNESTLTLGEFNDGGIEPIATVYDKNGNVYAYIRKASSIRYAVDYANGSYFGSFNGTEDAMNALTQDMQGNEGVPDAPFRNTYHEYVLKNILRMAAEQGYDKIAWTTGKMQEDRWSSDYAEAYRIEYDQDIPKFLNKYGKKWGAKVGTTKIISGPQMLTVPSIDITDAMRESVLYEGQPMYSLQQNNTNGYDYTKSFAEQLDDWDKGLIPQNDSLMVSGTPKVLQQIGFNQLPVTINQEHIDFAINGTKDTDHHITKPVLSQLPQSLEKPVAVIRSQSTPTRVVAILSLTNPHNKKQIIVPLEIDGSGRQNNIRIDTNAITTIFGKSNALVQMKKAIETDSNNDNKLFYWNKKEALSLLQRAGLQLSGGLPQDGFIHSIRDKGSKVKWKFNDVTETQQFKRWFGKSKIVNADGTPKVMYHGSDASFSVFDVNKAKASGYYGKGFYFTDSESHASTYGKLYPAYLSVQMPLEYGKNKISKNQTIAFLEAVAENEDYSIENYGTYDISEIMSRITSTDAFSVIQDVNATAIGDMVEAVKLFNSINSTKFDGIITPTETIVFEPTQIKSATDNIGTFDSENPDIYYSLDEDGEPDLFDIWKSKVDEFGAIPKGENPARDIDVPEKIDKDKLVSRFARTMLEAGITPDTAVSEFEKRVLDGTMTHEVVTNDAAREWAVNQIKYHGFEEALNSWEVYTRDGNVGKKELALGMELYNQCITNGDVTNAMKIAAELVAEATHAGQTLQATRMLKLMTPDGQLYYLEKSIQKMNEEFKKKIGDKYEDIELNEDLMEKFLTEKDADKRDEIYDDICQNIADQIPATLLDKWNSWRYLAMLGNARTHIRNIAGNAVFVPAIKLKNYIGAAIEIAAKVDAEKRTKSLRKNKDAVDFAKKDFRKMQKVLQGENAKYAVTSDIEGKRTIFKTKWLESLRNKNFEWLEKEDMWFLEKHYVDALAQIITARKLDVNNIDEKTLDIARAYAVREAQRATYRDANSLAEALNKLQKKAEHSDKKAIRATNLLIEGVMPFKKTPLNIAKQGVQYSPIGILSGIYKIADKVKGGKAYSTTDIIDDFAKGLTGTAIMLLGTLLASLGIISGGADDNKKKKEFDKMVGEQAFSLNIGDSSYTIDWMTPACLPLFTGVELYELTKDDFKFADIVTALSSLTDPLLELSVFSGISGAIESAQYNDTNTLYAIGSDMTTSYLTQALPTIGGQLSRIIDKNKREYYYTDKNSNLPKGLQNIMGQAASKIPFASYLFEPAIDEWGREETYGNLFERAVENAVSPGYYAEKNYTAVDNEIKRLYESTGDASVLPVIQQKKYTEAKVDYPMTAEQYTEAKRIRGQKSFALINNLIKSNKYKSMSDVEKAAAIAKCYREAGEYAKEQMINKVKRNK